MSNHARFTILGAGSYGTALAVALAQLRADKENETAQVVLWGRNKSELDLLRAQKENKNYLPGVKLPSQIYLESDLKKAISASDIIFIVVPSSSFSFFLDDITPFLTKFHRIVSCTKGFEFRTGRFLSTLIEEKCPQIQAYAVLSGPSFALELAKGLPTGLVLATKHQEFAKEMKSLLAPERFALKIEINDDIYGVQIGGAVKNVIAIAVGISDGLGFGSNTRTALIIHGLNEIRNLAHALGAKTDTIFGLSGLGDLILTCTDDKSRNRRFGIKIGQGKGIEEAIKEIDQVVEGYVNTQEVVLLAGKLNVSMPIVTKVFEILYQQKSAYRASRELLLSLR